MLAGFRLGSELAERSLCSGLVDLLRRAQLPAREARPIRLPEPRDPQSCALPSCATARDVHIQLFGPTGGGLVPLIPQVPESTTLPPLTWGFAFQPIALDVSSCRVCKLLVTSLVHFARSHWCDKFDRIPSAVSASYRGRLLITQ